ncbi:guanine nucleotide exchange factor MSS4 homolog [Epargyreus clarus]|uniref:guanine nucleotide exchange factor MSS4 homolog n=1 Tax=Epargyreus clarus TaxID=520877 RepID=UPI003C2DB2FE
MSEANNSSKSQDDLAKQFVEDGTNKLVVKCKFCGSKILDKNSGKYVSQEIELPLMQQDTRKDSSFQNETLKDFYHVENMYTFENIGFTHTVANRKYLSCADCDAGPVGYCDMDSKHSYVALARIEHC